MDWQACSEIVGGLLIKNKISSHNLDPQWFMKPISEMVTMLVSGHSKETVASTHLSVFQTCKYAAEQLNGAGEDINWIEVLETKAHAYKMGEKLGRLSNQMQAGDEIDYANLRNLVGQAQLKVAERFMPLSEVADKDTVLVETGWPLLDYHIGGLPEVGVTLCLAAPKVGKTTFAIKLAQKYAHAHPDKKVAFFTLEMINTQIKKRFKEIASTEYPNILLCDAAGVTPQQIIAWSASIDNLGLVIVDFLDMIGMAGEMSEPQMSGVYLTLTNGSKNLHAPIFALAQLSGKYTGGIPKPHMARWTRLAEAFTPLMLALWNPNLDYYAEEKTKKLPVMDGYAYVGLLLARFGLPNHPEDQKGALLMRYHPKKGWDYKDDDKGKFFNDF